MTELPFTPGFLWGAATSAHQTEGGNVASDHWALETGPNPPARVEVVSGDACDSYHRYGEDIALVAGSGLGAYRFSIEWARIEPAEGVVLQAQLQHYRRMVQACLDAGIQPVPTLCHATLPAWLGREGGWDSERSPELFARYVELLVPVLEGVQWVCTINEPNMSAIYDGGLEADIPGGLPPAKEPWATHLIEAHHLARRVLKSARPDLKVGWTVGMQGFRLLPGSEEFAADYCGSREWRYLEAAREDDFIGVQNYTAIDISADGPVQGPEGQWRNMLGWQLDPVSVAECVADAHARTGVPVLVTESGLATADDTERIEYVRQVLEHLQPVTQQVPVLGFLYWTLLDNYEWGSYFPTFGLVGVDRETFERRPKPSLAWLGQVARANAVPVEVSR